MNGQQWRRWAIDAGERVGATALAAACGYGITVAVELPVWAVVPVSTGLTLVKAWASAFAGRKGSAAALPRSVDPGARG